MTPSWWCTNAIQRKLCCPGMVEILWLWRESDGQFYFELNRDAANEFLGASCVIGAMMGGGTGLGLPRERSRIVLVSALVRDEEVVMVGRGGYKIGRWKPDNWWTGYGCGDRDQIVSHYQFVATWVDDLLIICKDLKAVILRPNARLLSFCLLYYLHA